MVDYSKWKTIEVSDDEDDTHPNIDTPSLFRWRHQARVERMQKDEEEQRQFECERKRFNEALKNTKEKLSSAKDEEQIELLQAEIKELQEKEETLKKKADMLAKKNKLTPWNVDTLSKDGFSKSIINTPKVAKQLTDEEKHQQLLSFVENNEKKIKAFGMLADYSSSSDFLRDNPDLVCDETASYLTMWCVTLQVEEKTALMERVAHQAIVMQYILELAKQLTCDPRSCVTGFFKRMKSAEKQYIAAFQDELNAFKERVKGRARIRIQEAIRKAEEEEREKRLGPGGLDPVEVLESLPSDLRECFESRCVSKLQETLSKLPKEEAAMYMKMCVDSGLWVPDAKAAGLTPASEELQKGFSNDNNVLDKKTQI